MGLRDFLSNFRSVQDASAGALDSATNLRKQMAQQDLQQQLPQILANKDLGQLASQSLAAGDPGPLNAASHALATNLLPKPPTSKAPGLVTDSFIKQAKGLAGVDIAPGTPMDEAKVLLTAAQKKSGQDNDMDKFSKSEQRRIKQFQFQTGTKTDDEYAMKFAAPLVKKQTEIEDGINDYQAKLKAFNEKPSAMAGNLLARALIKASGDNRVSDYDVQALQFKSLPKDWEAFKNKFSGSTNVEMTDAEIKELKRVAGVMGGALENSKKNVLGKMVQSQAQIHSGAIREGRLTPQLQYFANLTGQDADVRPDGKIEFKAHEGSTQTKKVGNDAGQAPEFVNKIKNPARKADVMKYLEGRALGESGLKELEARLKKEGSL